MVWFDFVVVLSMQGVEGIFDMGEGIVVVVVNMWFVNCVVEVVDIEWQDVFYFVDNDDILLEICVVFDSDISIVGCDDGDVEVEVFGIEILVEYSVLFFVYMMMELMNVIVVFNDGQLEVWVGNQVLIGVQNVCVDEVGIDLENVILYILIMGGGLGCCVENDIVVLVVWLVK